MHIPDGLLSPSTSLALYTICTPFILKASKVAKEKISSKTVPLISLFSALSFVIMMFNIPLPGGTTGHAVGAVIASIVLGPWVAMLSVTVALLIQALFFGDGGILTLGANVFNMAILMTLSGSFIYHLLDKWSMEISKRKVIFAAVSGYLSINLAALSTGFILGIQPLLFSNSSGQALYFPFGLKISIPAMMIGHLTIAGFAEGLVTALTLSWILKTNPGLLTLNKKKTVSENKIIKWSLIGLGILTIFTPIGLLAPGTAWGEWGRDELQQLGLNYIPAGYDRLTSIWKAPLPDYDFPILGNQTISYIISAGIGIVLILFLIRGAYLIVKKI